MNLILRLISYTLYFFLRPIPAYAQSAWSGDCVYDSDVATLQGLECLFTNILSLVTPAAGLVFLAMFIIGGYNYLFSGGDPKKAAQASSTLTMAFIGIVGVIIAFLVMRFIETFTGAKVTEFDIPQR